MTHTINSFAPTTEDSLIEYKGKYYTGTDIEAMRDWIADCQWADLDIDDTAKLSDHEVLHGIACNYSGGIAQFLADNA